MPVNSKTLGAVINAAKKELGEPEITSFTSGDILEERLIEQANNAVRELVAIAPYRWTRKRTILVTTDDITTDSAAVTNASTTVTSVDSSGTDADSFTGATTSMFFRATGTQKSYKISSIDTGSSPDTVTLETAYLDTTSTAIGYRMFQDTYSITDSDFGELMDAQYGDGASWVSAIGGGGYPDNRLIKIPHSKMLQLAGGDPHRDTSGRPRYISEIGVDSSNQQQFVLWPFPTDAYLIELWYSLEFTENTTFATVMFDTDAPSSAYDFVEHKVCAAAHMWDESFGQASVFEQKAQVAAANIVRLENMQNNEVGFDVQTFRRHYGINYEGRSGTLFDTVLRR